MTLLSDNLQPRLGRPDKRRMQLLSARRRSRLQGELFPDVPAHFWQARFYDFNVWTAKKRIDKLRYMHRNPVMRKLLWSAEQWRWSSYRAYAHRERGVVAVNAMFPPKWPRKVQAA